MFMEREEAEGSRRRKGGLSNDGWVPNKAAWEPFSGFFCNGEQKNTPKDPFFFDQHLCI